jgi:hypothetical protein
MRKLLFAALLPAAVWGQGFQNREIVFEAGPAWAKSGTVAGTDIHIGDSLGWAWHTGYGYQLTRVGAVSALLDLSFLFADPGNVAQGQFQPTVATSYNTITAGLRFMVPLESRLTFFPVAGGGFGWFRTPSAGTIVNSRNTTHGVFQFGGGGDVRLTSHFSLRAEVRDVVTGRQLSGASGRHHPIPLFGVAMHF